jgi:hypothetical protein
MNAVRQLDHPDVLINFDQNVQEDRTAMDKCVAWQEVRFLDAALCCLT